AATWYSRSSISSIVGLLVKDLRRGDLYALDPRERGPGLVRQPRGQLARDLEGDRHLTDEMLRLSLVLPVEVERGGRQVEPPGLARERLGHAGLQEAECGHVVVDPEP